MLLSVNLMEGFQCLFVYMMTENKKIFLCIYNLRPEVSSIFLDQSGGGRDSTQGGDLCSQGIMILVLVVNNGSSSWSCYW